MRNSKHIAWLYEQLPALVSDGVLTAETAQSLRRRYGDVSGGRGLQIATLFGVIGAVLIGGGVILLLAHNWDNLSRSIRAALCFAPLLAAQAVAGRALWRHESSTGWREGAGALLTLAIGASIALVAQTYNIGGDISDFLLTWTLLALPVAYLLRAAAPAILYLAGVSAWAGAQWNVHAQAYGFWALLALALPWWWYEARGNPYRPRPILFAWIFALVLPLGLAASLRDILEYRGLFIPLVGAVAGALFLIGRRYWGEAVSSSQKPLQSLGALALVGAGLVYSYGDNWRWLAPSWGGSVRPLSEEIAAFPLAWAIAAMWFAVWLYFWIESFRFRDMARSALGATPLFLAIGLGLAIDGRPEAAMLLMNVYLFALGVATLVAGVRAGSLGLVNGGMIIVSAVILCRFFDAYFGFLLRGVAFIVIGAGFLIVNLVMMRKKGGVQS